MSKIQRASEILNEKELRVVGDMHDNPATNTDKRYNTITKNPAFTTEDDNVRDIRSLSANGISRENVEELDSIIKNIKNIFKEHQHNITDFTNYREGDLKFLITNLITFSDILQHNKELITKLLNINLENIRKK